MREDRSSSEIETTGFVFLTFVLAGSIFGLIGFWGGNAFGLPTYASSAIAAAIGLGAAVVCARSAMIRRLIAKALEFSNWF